MTGAFFLGGWQSFAVCCVIAAVVATGSYAWWERKNRSKARRTPLLDDTTQIPFGPVSTEARVWSWPYPIDDEEESP